MENPNPKVPASVLTLRWTFVIVPIAAGLDKFFELLADWNVYLAPVVRELLPVSADTFLFVAGGIEILVGLLMATRYVKIAAYVAAAWLTAIALQLIVAGYLDIAVRDLAMAVAAWTLGSLSPAVATRPDEQPAVVEARA